MTLSRERPPLVADERTQLVGWLNQQRALAQLLDEFEAQCAQSNEIVATHSLDDVGKHPDFKAAQATLRWMLIHMVEETARHVGHLDAMRRSDALVY
ncbi:uncharacterized protein DUF664 [Kribbella sp. VKM Ac-2569]|nr:DUF664 domain-containing protein [Kribbella sp. VKM Ac-2569]RZT12937.1 uncharacterized protein DUF664 [Kribbella sp. VKM Ac-2569]